MQTFDIDIIPKGINPVVYCSQNDVGRQLKFYMYDGAISYEPPVGGKVFIEGKKPDNNGFSYECTYDGNEVTVTLTEQMTVLFGDVLCELRIIKDSLTIGTLNFILRVEESPINGDVPISDTEIPAIISLAEEQAQRAETAAIESKSYAVGGTDTRTGEDTDNSKYYKEQSALLEASASDSAISAGNSATSAHSDSLISEGFAVGKQNNVDVGSDSPYFHNNSKYYSEEALESAQAALLAEENAAHSEEILEFYADFEIPQFIIANNRLYVNDAAALEFAVANNRLYVKVAS